MIDHDNAPSGGTPGRAARAWEWLCGWAYSLAHRKHHHLYRLVYVWHWDGDHPTMLHRGTNPVTVLAYQCPWCPSLEQVVTRALPGIIPPHALGLHVDAPGGLDPLAATPASVGSTYWQATRNALRTVTERRHGLDSDADLDAATAEVTIALLAGGFVTSTPADATWHRSHP